MTGFCPILSEFVIVLHNILPTTSPLADFSEVMVLSVIPNPITKFFFWLILFIELYFYKNINAHKKNIFKAKEYFLRKLSNVKKYNLDIETFFLEFKDLLK